MPRVLDVLNTYLRAVEVKDLEARRAGAAARADAAADPGGDRRRQGARPPRHRIRAELGRSPMDLLMNGLLMAANALRRRLLLGAGAAGARPEVARQGARRRDRHADPAESSLPAPPSTRRAPRRGTPATSLPSSSPSAEGAAGQLQLLLAAAPLPATAPARRPRRRYPWALLRRYPPARRSPPRRRSPPFEPAGAAARAVAGASPRPVTPHLVEVPPPVVKAAAGSRRCRSPGRWRRSKTRCAAPDPCRRRRAARTSSSRR